MEWGCIMDREQYLLGKLAEEASEISQIALKTQQFGMDEVYEEASNKERCHEELNDLLSIVKMLNVECNFDYRQPNINLDVYLKKVDKVNKYYNYSKELGRVK